MGARPLAIRAHESPPPSLANTSPSVVPANIVKPRVAARQVLPMLALVLAVVEPRAAREVHLVGVRRAQQAAVQVAVDGIVGLRVLLQLAEGLARVGGLQ